MKNGKLVFSTAPSDMFLDWQDLLIEALGEEEANQYIDRMEELASAGETRRASYTFDWAMKEAYNQYMSSRMMQTYFYNKARDLAQNLSSRYPGSNFSYYFNTGDDKLDKVTNNSQGYVPGKYLENFLTEKLLKTQGWNKKLAYSRVYISKGHLVIMMYESDNAWTDEILTKVYDIIFHDSYAKRTRLNPDNYAKMINIPEKEE